MRRILVIDDDASVRAMFEMLLPLDGYEVVTASNGARAVVAAGSDPYDVIIADLWLPDMHGYQALRMIRIGGLNARTPIVVLTADVDGSGTEQEPALGVIEHLEKPFDLDVLQHALASAVAR